MVLLDQNTFHQTTGHPLHKYRATVVLKKGINPTEAEPMIKTIPKTKVIQIHLY